jgi:hypothetical protein
MDKNTLHSLNLGFNPDGFGHVTKSMISCDPGSHEQEDGLETQELAWSFIQFVEATSKFKTFKPLLCSYFMSQT